MTAKLQSISVCIFSGNRADFGPLEPVINEAAQRSEISLSVIINKAHIPSDLHEKCQVLEIDLALENNSTEETIVQATKSLTQVGAHLQQLKPDCLIILGDRFEALSAAQAATICQIPIVHICGGDQSLGSFDDKFRNAITQLSALHFVTHDIAAERVIAMGALPAAVHNVGHPGIINWDQLATCSKSSLYNELQLNEYKPAILVCFHSVTAEADMGKAEFEEVVSALEKLVQAHDLQILATAANPDPFGTTINATLKSLEMKYENFHFEHTLGRDRFFAMLQYADIFTGNSSAILYEAPVMGLHALDIGTRQKGRVRPHAVRHSDARADVIFDNILKLVSAPKPDRDFFFGDGSSARQIVDILATDIALLATD